MAIYYVDKITKEKVEKNFICDRCAAPYKSMCDAHIIRHTFGNGSLYAGKAIEIVLCETCLLRLAFEWAATNAEEQKSKRKSQSNEFPFYDDKFSNKLTLHSPVHPGEFLLEVYLKPAHISIAKAAKLIGVDRNWMQGFVMGKSKITQVTADKLSEHFGSSVTCWLNMQSHFDSSVKRLKGFIPFSGQAVSLTKMDKTIRRAATKSAKVK